MCCQPCSDHAPRAQPAQPRRFSAPECFLGVFSPQSDLFGVGVVLYLLMTGKMPFSDGIFAEWLQTEAFPSQSAEMRQARQPPCGRYQTTSAAPTPCLEACFVFRGLCARERMSWRESFLSRGDAESQESSTFGTLRKKGREVGWRR